MVFAALISKTFYINAWSIYMVLTGNCWNFSLLHLGKKIIMSCPVSDSGLLGNWKHPCVLILSQYVRNDSGPKEEISVFWNLVQVSKWLTSVGSQLFPKQYTRSMGCPSLKRKQCLQLWGKQKGRFLCGMILNRQLQPRGASGWRKV